MERLQEYLKDKDSRQLKGELNTFLNGPVWPLLQAYLTDEAEKWKANLYHCVQQHDRTQEAAAAAGKQLACEYVKDRMLLDILEILSGTSKVVEEPRPEE